MVGGSENGRFPLEEAVIMVLFAEVMVSPFGVGSSYPAAACRKWFGFVIFLVISTQCNWVGSWLGNWYEPQSWWFASTSENRKGLVMNINIGGFHYIDGGAVEDSGSAVITELANG